MCTHSRDLSLTRKLLTLLTGIWSHGDIHTTDIEFGRLFAKFIETSRSDGERPTTQDVLKLHKTLLDAVDAAKAKGFAKDPAEKVATRMDVCYKANLHIEYFNIKPLSRHNYYNRESGTAQISLRAAIGSFSPNGMDGRTQSTHQLSRLRDSKSY
jgi:hypothetical protein